MGTNGSPWFALYARKTATITISTVSAPISTGLPKRLAVGLVRAIAEDQKALRLKPDLPQAHSNLGVVLHDEDARVAPEFALADGFHDAAQRQVVVGDC